MSSKYIVGSETIKKFLSSLQCNSKNEHNNKYPKISIITPSYNQAKFLERTIISVLNQNYPNLEYIIIDGGSTDGSVEIIKKYEKYLYYWVSEPDKGQTDALNKGLKISSGDILAFQNSDDIYLPDTFKTISRNFLLNPEVGVVYGDFLHIDENDNILDIQLLIKAHYWMQVFKGPQIHNQSAFWARWTYNKVGDFNEKYQFDMDYDFFSRILLYKIPSIHVKKFLGAFRHHHDSKTSTINQISKIEYRDVSQKYKSMRLTTKFVPYSIGKNFGTIYKSFVHIKDRRMDYLLRDRLKFK